MSFDWTALIGVARLLQQTAAGANDPEATLRSALSRAYYGAFCLVRNHARDRLGFEPRNDPDDHGRLRAHLRGKRRNLAVKLDRLRQWRNESDYADQLSFELQAAVTAALQEADAIVNLLSSPNS